MLERLTFLAWLTRLLGWRQRPAEMPPELPPEVDLAVPMMPQEEVSIPHLRSGTASPIEPAVSPTICSKCKKQMTVWRQYSNGKLMCVPCASRES